LFFERTGMNPARVEAIVAESLAGMDDGELYLEYSQSESWRSTMVASRARASIRPGFGLRAVCRRGRRLRPRLGAFGSGDPPRGSDGAAVASGYSGVMAVGPVGTKPELYTRRTRSAWSISRQKPGSSLRSTRMRAAAIPESGRSWLR